MVSKKAVTTLNKNASNPAHIKSIKAGHASFTVTTYASKNAKKFQARYSTNKNMNGAKTTTSDSSTIKVTGRAENKTYYVQTRTYKTVKGKNYYSNWSPTKSVKTQSHSFKPVYKTEPVYEDVPVYETKQKMVEEQSFYCAGCHVDCILEAQKLGYSGPQAFHMMHCTGRDGLSCPCTYGDPNSMVTGAAFGAPVRKMYPLYKPVAYWYCSKEYFDDATYPNGEPIDTTYDFYVGTAEEFDADKLLESIPEDAMPQSVGATNKHQYTVKYKDRNETYIQVTFNVPVYETVQTGTKKIQTGTKKVVSQYKCSCGKTKK